MKLSKMKGSVEISSFDYFDGTTWEWFLWFGDIKIDYDKEFATKAGCKRSFERFAKDNGIKDFKYV